MPSIALGILTHSGSLTGSGQERAALRDGPAEVHGELERLDSVVLAGLTGRDVVWRAHLDVVE